MKSKIRELLQESESAHSWHWDELKELERLAKIGKATEKAFEDGKYITDASCKTLSNVDDLIDWAVEND